jgi:hypothetical protein
MACKMGSTRAANVCRVHVYVLTTLISEELTDYVRLDHARVQPQYMRLLARRAVGRMSNQVRRRRVKDARPSEYPEGQGDEGAERVA